LEDNILYFKPQLHHFWRPVFQFQRCGGMFQTAFQGLTLPICPLGGWVPGWSSLISDSILQAAHMCLSSIPQAARL
jgi:hypothetical protein